MAAMFTSGGLTIRVYNMQPFRVYPWQAYVPPGDGPWLMSGVLQVAAPPTALSGEELHATYSAVSQALH